MIEYVAHNVRGTVRDIEGMVNSLLAHATLTNGQITMELASELVEKAEDMQQHNIDVDDIEKVVCDYFNLDVKEIHTKSRKREIAQARQVAMYLARKFTKKSLAAIGAQIGNRDHATVLHACKTVENLMETDKEIRQSLSSIESKLK